MQVTDAVRASNWWESKVGLALGTGYATAFLTPKGVARAWPAFATTVAALVVAAVYVSVVNDLTDREADRIAGKPNRVGGWSFAAVLAVLAGCAGLGACIAGVGWWPHPLPLLLYAGCWIAFTTYSCPPVRLKERGLAGPIADAAGAHLFPSLLMIAATALYLRHDIAPAWAALVSAWAAAHGMSEILWHQVRNAQLDAQSQTLTFARCRPTATRRLLESALPIELCLFAAMTVYAGLPAVGVILAVYLVWAQTCLRRSPGLRSLRGSIDLRLRYIIDGYYMVFFPLLVLLIAALHQPVVLLVAVVHCALFHGTLVSWATRAVRALPRLNRPAIVPAVSGRADARSTERPGGQPA